MAVGRGGGLQKMEEKVCLCGGASQVGNYVKSRVLSVAYFCLLLFHSFTSNC